MRKFGMLLPLFLVPVISFAAEIILPAPALERDRPVSVIYRTAPQATGKGELTVQWTDVYGRTVDDRKIPVELTDETDIGFTLDLRRAVAMRNDLRVHFSFDGINKKGVKDHRDEEAAVSFVARPPDRKWWDYSIIMWEPYSAANFAVLKTLGVNAGQYNGKAGKPPEFLLKNDLRWYAENIATDFYSEYHRYRPDRIQHWSFLQAKELYKKDPAGKEAFKRHPSFSDPEWLQRIHDRLVASARANSPYRPVFYDLADESGIADLASYWDFDFSDQSLAEMRVWLQQRYGTLPALNRQWGTNFSYWSLVTPETTNEAMKRADGNFSSWADHKEWMDVSFARALKMGVDAIKSVDPDAYVAIGGAQMPGWGGYDYARLSQVLTAMEPYDIGDNIEIIRSVNPDVAVVTTAFGRGPWEKHRIWYELLHGSRGNLIWDDAFENVSKDGVVGERGHEVAPYYNELRNGVGALLTNSVRQSDPIAIHYSQASMRTEWMLAQQPKGAAWVDRSSARERMDSDFLRMRESYCRLVEDLGLQYNFVAYGQVEDGELQKRGYRVLILPRSSSLSELEAKAIREFVDQGGVLIADGEPGVFDSHSRRLPKPLLSDLFEGAHRGKAIRVNADVLNYHQKRLVRKEGEIHQLMGKLIAESGVHPAFAVVDESNHPVVGVETHQFRNGGVTIIGLLSNPQFRVNELGPAEFKSNQRFETPRPVRLKLPAEMYAYDIRAGKSLGRKSEIAVAVDPYEPVLLAFSPGPLPALKLAAPQRIERGESARIGLGFDSATPAATHLFHVEVLDPSGKPVAHYSGNVLAPGGHAEKFLPVAGNDASGGWTVRVRDLLSGQEQTAAIEVR